MDEIEFLVRTHFGDAWSDTKNKLSDDVSICRLKDVPLSTWCLYCSAFDSTWLVYKDDKGDHWTPWFGDEEKLVSWLEYICPTQEAVQINSPFLPTPTNADLAKYKRCI